MSRTTMLNVNEMFGPTIQGEGRMAGHLCSFLRLANCNLTCSWCDTPYTWDWTRHDRKAEVHPMSVNNTAAYLNALPGRIVVSGGEPLLQVHALSELLARLPGRSFDVETNGTRPLGRTEGMWATVTCSPKIIPSAEQDRAIAHEVHPSIAEVADFKFVVRDDADLEAVVRWLGEDPQGSKIGADRVWLMPEGTDHATLTGRTPWLMKQAVRLGFNFTTRLHVYGWADVRGH